MFGHPHICIFTKEDLSDDAILSWFAAVTEAGPPGILASIETQPGQPQIAFYRRKLEDGNHYIAALARDLTNEEATNIAKSYSDRNHDGDFEVRWSQVPSQDQRPAELAENVLKAIALEAAKHNHNHWLRKRTNEGWRYGTSHDHRNRTSPTCRDWDSLPESYRSGEYQRMVSLLETLDKMNLRISKK